MEELNLSDTKDLITIAKPVLDPLISAILKPHIEKLGNVFKKKSKEVADSSTIQDKFTEYLVRTLYSCENINILIFQNEQIKLMDIYYPLSIVSSKTHKKTRIDNFKLEMISDYEKILISDTAGMGKSTLSKFICLKTIENSFAIPILIELRNLKENHTILDEIIRQFNPIDKIFDKDLLLEFLNLGKFLIILDGFDEINFKDQEIIIKDIRDFINKAPRNYFILTSRPEGSLAAFGDFKSFNIAPLETNEAFELIKKYDTICSVGVGDKLIADIKDHFNQTKELLRNPFLVSLIYSTYTFNQDIPSSKATFYEEIYSALFKRHDLSKDGFKRPKKSKLDIQQFRTVLRQLAFDTARAGTIVYTEQELLKYIEGAKERCPGHEFSSTDFLDDLLSSVPLFQKDGLSIKWAHKSLQDFFFADFVAFNVKKEEIIQRIYDSKRDSYLNMLDLFYEIDIKTFRNIITERILVDFITHYETTYTFSYSGIDSKDIDLRKSLSYDTDAVFSRNDDHVDFGGSMEKITDQFPELAADKHQTSVIENSHYWVHIYYTLNRKIVNLLRDKHVKFIENIEDRSKKKFNVNLTKENGMLRVDDDPTSILNSKNNFAAVTRYMDFASNNGTAAYINFQKAKVELAVIRKEKERELQAEKFDDL